MFVPRRPVMGSQGALWGLDSPLPPPVTMQYVYTFEHAVTKGLVGQGEISQHFVWLKMPVVLQTKKMSKRSVIRLVAPLFSETRINCDF